MNAAASASLSPARVVVTFVVLCVLLGTLAWIAQGFLSPAVDGAALQREYFGEHPPPYGLTLESAGRLPGGEALVRFTRAGAGGGPDELVFLSYPDHAAVETLFRPAEEMAEGMEGGPGERLKQWEKDPSFAWHFTMKRDVISWGTWSSKLWIERAFAQGGGWREEARVDISAPGKARVLFAHWPTGVAIEERALTELLATLQLGTPPADAH